MTNGPDYEGVLEDLIAQRDKINNLIAGLEAVMAGSGGSTAAPTGGGSTGARSKGQIRADTFFKMSILDAAIKYLDMAGEPMTPTQIADALERGGLEHGSQNLGNTLYTTLSRSASHQGPVVKVGKSWGLGKWYPGSGKAAPRPKRNDADTAARVTGGAQLVGDDKDDDEG